MIFDFPRKNPRLARNSKELGSLMFLLVIIVREYFASALRRRAYLSVSFARRHVLYLQPTRRGLGWDGSPPQPPSSSSVVALLAANPLFIND